MGTVLRGDCDRVHGRCQATSMRFVRQGLAWNGCPDLMPGYIFVIERGRDSGGAVGQRARTQEWCSMAEAQVDGKGPCSQSKVHVDDAWGDDEKM
jgi:hypothetical protein